MNEHERYLFDLQGFLVVLQALNADEVAELNEIMERQVEQAVSPDASTHRFGNLLSWGPAYCTFANFGNNS